MYKIDSDTYQNIIYNSDTSHTLLIYLDGVEIDRKYLKSLSFKDECFSEDKFILGSVTYAEIKMVIGKEAIRDITSANCFYLEEVVKNDSESFHIPIGYFYVVPDKVDTTNEYTITFTLYDKMYDLSLSGLDFSEEVLQGNFTRLDLVNLICEKYGLELATPSFLNHDVLIGTYDSELSAKAWLGFIAERAGGFAKVGRDNKLYIKSYGEVDKIVIPNTSKGDLKSGDLKTISKVVYQNATQKFETGDDTGITVYLAQDNYFSCSQEEVDNIYESLIGLQFQTLKVRIWGDSSIDTGDIIQINDYITFCQKDWNWGNGFYGYYDTTLEEVSSAIEVSKLNNNQKQRRIMSLMDELNSEIRLLIQETDGNTEQISKLFMDLQSILLSIQNSGGNNLIFNSVGFAGTSEWELAFDNEDTSTVESIASVSLLEQGTSGGAFRMNGVKMTQEITVNSNTNYSFSCVFFKKASSSAYIKLYNKNDETEIWQKELDYLTEYDYEKASFNDISINGNTLVVELYGDEDSSFTVTDTMLAKGDFISVWTQASGEILNTQVNININGVLVKSLQYDENGQYTVISPLEFAGYANKNGVSTRVFTLNGDTTVVEKIRANSMIAMYPIKIVSIITGSNQGWAHVVDGGEN